MVLRKVRPRFRLAVPREPAEVIDRIVARVRQQDRPCRAMVSGEHRLIELRVNESESHFWSPALSVSVNKNEDGGRSIVNGLVGPNPNLWTLFAMLYMGLWTGVMFSGVFGLVQWSLSNRPWGLWILAALAVALLLLYAASQIGQRFAAPQTAMLRRVLEEALEIPAAERARTEQDPYRKMGPP